MIDYAGYFMIYAIETNTSFFNLISGSRDQKMAVILRTSILACHTRIIYIPYL